MGRAVLASASTASATAGGGGWAELPEALLLLVLDRLPSVADLFAVAAVCRSWRALAGPPASASIGGDRPPLLLSPRLAPLNPRSSRGYWVYPQRCRLLSPADPAASYRCLVPPSLLVCPFLGYSHGHLIFYREGCPVLADVARGDVLQAPKLPQFSEIQHAVLTAPLSAPDCDLLLLSFCMSFPYLSRLLRWRVGQRAWSEYRLGEDTVCMNRIAVFRGRIFTLDLRGRLFTVKFSPYFSMAELVVQWTPESSGPGTLLPFRTHLVECGGELMLVRFVTAQWFSCTKVEVFRLDLSGPPSGERVESLGDRALFLDLEHGSSVSCPNPGRWGGRSNCIYLARRASETWTALPLDGEEMDVRDPKSPLYWVNNSWPKWPSPIWVYPSMLY